MNRNTLDGWAGLDQTQTCSFLRSPDDDNQKWGQHIKQASSFKKWQLKAFKVGFWEMRGVFCQIPMHQAICTHLFSSTYIYVFAKRGWTTKGLYSSTKPGVYIEKEIFFTLELLRWTRKTSVTSVMYKWLQVCLIVFQSIGGGRWIGAR